ncbi:MAG: DUF3500 domain-containing protein [Saprospiraceae bacterium]|nr:DUF3500 domain-containing protein [Saprospiraceae bacterium]
MKGIALALIVALIFTLVLYENNALRDFILDQPENEESVLDMRSAALDFLATLPGGKMKNVVFPFQSEERYDWHFIPRPRPGISWEAMDDAQREKAVLLLKSALSQQGYEKSREIMQLEEVLRELEGRPATDRVRHPGLYYFSFFGHPDTDSLWSWRFEGHHLSLNFSVVGGQLAVTPSFMGANPAEVPSGPQKGKRVLKREEEAARALMAAFSEEDRARAIIAKTAPRGIITGTDRKASLDRYEGIPAAELGEEQIELLRQLLAVYTGNMKPEIAGQQRKRIEEEGFDKLYFAWAGSTNRGEPHYYRIHGPTFLVEYDNTQNSANHIHSVWRNLENDFGEDLLRRHYDQSGSEHRH